MDEIQPVFIEDEIARAFAADLEIEAAAYRALANNGELPRDRFSLNVENRWITLYGIVSTDRERRLAEQAVRSVHGIRGLTNRTILRRPPANDVRWSASV